MVRFILLKACTNIVFNISKHERVNNETIPLRITQYSQKYISILLHLKQSYNSSM